MDEARLRFLETLTAGLESMLRTGSHADTTIVVDGRVFPCHKVVLSAMSPYFEAMFNHDMIETRGGIVTLYDIEPDVFDCLLRYMYTGVEVVDHNNAEQIFKASSMLQIPCLQQRCEDFLLTQVSKDNCLGIWKIARAHNCKNLAEITLISIVEHFPEICNSDDFQSLEVDDMVALLSSESLAVPNEESVCDAVVSWLKFEPSRQSHCAAIFEVLRLPLVTPEYLFSLLEEDLNMGDKASDCIQDAFKFHLFPSRRAHFSSKRFQQRRHSERNDCLVIIGGLLKTVPRFQTTKEVVCYSFQQQQWFYLPSMPYDPGYEFAVCSHGSDIYVSGGWLKLQGLAVYKSEQNKWIVCDTMTNGRCGHCMVATTNAIYVFGGRDGTAPALNNIEEFDLRSKKWRIAGELILGIRSMSSAVAGEAVFLFGGITETDKDSDKVQCFDTRFGTATIIGDLPFACRITRSVTIDKQVYIILPDGRVVALDDSFTSRKAIKSLSELSFSFDTEDSDRPASQIPLTSLRVSPLLPSPSSPKNFPVRVTEKENALGKVAGKISGFNQHHFEAIQHNGKLHLVGGKTPDNTILRDIVVVDPDGCKMVGQIEMPAARWCFGCEKIVIRKEYLQNAIGVV
ncbi:kelch-like protein 24 [Dreissena polymorpha]|uniref:kelch-like protein 24 n=1 Tax=Dreissena polymorpha TaxID=45954 RepID=UPI002264539F|nr:kelch-like protein 24 [Dreissena polymorpha]XP_052231371.1 kelch-like protein 24 [Dreissena polymorpha]